MLREMQICLIGWIAWDPWKCSIFLFYGNAEDGLGHKIFLFENVVKHTDPMKSVGFLKPFLAIFYIRKLLFHDLWAHLGVPQELIRSDR